MDRAGFSRERFDALRAEILRFAGRLEFASLDVIPGSALRGDMVVERGESLDWYRGPTLLERLETLPAGAEEAAAGPLRFPVQLAAKPQGRQARGSMGRIESGYLLAGTEVQVLPSGRRSHVRQIVVNGVEREIALAGDSVTLILADDIDVARGDLIVDAANPPREAKALEATLIWLGEEPLRPGARYLVQHAARRMLARVAEVRAQLDVNTLAEVAPAAAVGTNDIVQVRLAFQGPLFVDPYERVRATGSLILIDEATNHTVAAGLVR
jgi:sulfate adenylyltransferase subunit 1